MDTPPRWILRNVARRPVEIHTSADVQIVPPDGSIEVDAIGPHCAALIGRGLLTQHEAPPAGDGDTAVAAAKPRRRAADPPSDRAAGTKVRKGEGA